MTVIWRNSQKHAKITWTQKPCQKTTGDVSSVEKALNGAVICFGIALKLLSRDVELDREKTSKLEEKLKLFKTNRFLESVAHKYLDRAKN